MEILKNTNNALPIAKDAKKVGLLGIHSYHMICSGLTDPDAPRVSLTDAFKAAGYKLNSRGIETYEACLLNKKYRLKAPGSTCFRPKYRQAYTEFAFFSEDLVENVVDLSDVVIITIGRELCEGETVSQEEGGYLLNKAERELLFATSRRCTVKDKQLIVVLNTAYPIETESWAEQAAAIVSVGTPAPDEAHAIVKALQGK